MSRTFRNIPTHRPVRVRGRQAGERGKIPFIQRVPDGKRSFTVEVKRDDRATGLREHGVHRALAKQELRATDGDGLRAGKTRRYGDAYGEFRL